MYAYACILTAYLLAIKSDARYRAISYLLLFEFAAHEVVYVFCYQITELLQGESLLLAYIAIQTLTIYLMVHIQAHLAITLLILINIGYNVLTISQYVINYYDFYSIYPSFVGVIMALELIYLLGLSKYVGTYIRKHGGFNTSYIDKLFYVSRGIRLGRVS